MTRYQNWQMKDIVITLNFFLRLKSIPVWAMRLRMHQSDTVSRSIGNRAEEHHLRRP
jgi:hypothetical protein